MNEDPAVEPHSAGDGGEREAGDPDLDSATIPGADQEPAGNKGIESSATTENQRPDVSDGRPTGRVSFAPRASKAERMAAHRRNKRRRRVVGWTLLAVGLLVLVVAAWTGWKAYQAYRHLDAAATQVSRLQESVKDITDINIDAMSEHLERIQADSSAALSDVRDPIFRLVSHVPFIGPNLRAVSTVAGVVDSVSQRVLPTMVQAAKVIDPARLAPRGGAIDIAPIAAMAGRLQSADAVVQRARATLGDIDRGPLVGPVNSAVLQLWSKLDALSDYTGSAAMLGRLVPPMLGADGQRTYLVVFQNPAELRATGGIFGSYVVLGVDDGRISIRDQGSAARDIGNLTPPVGPVDRSLKDLYTSRVNTIPMDVNFTPDFPTAASLFATMYEQNTGEHVDGVIALDPVTVSYLLAGRAPIPIGKGLDLTQQNAVRVLLSTVYALFPERSDVEERDNFLAAATSTVFQKVMSGGIPANVMIKGLQRAASERRVLVWSAHPNEEADLTTTAVGGSLGAQPDALGVFFNDGTGAKLDYYLSGNVHVEPGQCDDQGQRALTLDIDMHYAAPSSGLPDYVLGLQAGGAPYVLRTNVVVMAPVGGSISSVTVDGRAVPVKSGVDHGHPMGVVTVDLRPGQHATVSAAVSTKPTSEAKAGTRVRPTVLVTPGATTWALKVEPYRACRVSQ